MKIQTDHVTEFCGYFYTTKERNGLWIGNARMMGNEITHLYPAYLLFAEASNIKNTLSLNNFSSALKQGLAQYKNDFEYNAARSTGGKVRSNVHYKDYSEFENNYIKQR
ncbi:primase-like DNA-binding domain-containing protein [Rodentibacter caecimuris]|uniref:primase-like DNA-binding domain-containing protein n=1 Tax=Rodentibacter caecimuris TaxID=1796644 RepID=UPI002582A513|nr:primase-like DNA-binding domain-containing protein [Rodentibacter heylii]